MTKRDFLKLFGVGATVLPLNAEGRIIEAPARLVEAARIVEASTPNLCPPRGLRIIIEAGNGSRVYGDIVSCSIRTGFSSIDPTSFGSSFGFDRFGPLTTTVELELIGAHAELVQYLQSSATSRKGRQ